MFCFISLAKKKNLSHNKLIVSLMCLFQLVKSVREIFFTKFLMVYIQYV